MLRVENLTVVRDGKDIVKNVSFNINPAEIHLILGVNGSGKTTLAQAIMGIYPCKGKIIFEGEDITYLALWERATRRITLAFQKPARFEGLFVNYYLMLSAKDKSLGRLEEIVKMVGLPRSILFQEMGENLSGGERKRVELASVLLMEPKLAILDEPDSGIDMLSFKLISEVIRKMRDMGTAVMLITHSEDMINIADRATVLCSGKVIATGNREEVKRLFKYSPCPLKR